MEENELYAAIGEDGFRRLVANFYKQVPGDDILGPMYPEGGFVEAESRLLSYLIYRFGGPQTYIEERGHPRLRARHLPFDIGQAARDRWIELMWRSLGETKLPADADALLRQFFDHVATFMMNRE